jgi:hypothetical protein
MTESPHFTTNPQNPTQCFFCHQTVRRWCVIFDYPMCLDCVGIIASSYEDLMAD